MADKSSAVKTKSPFKWPIRLAIAVVIYTLVGFFIVPAIIKSQMLKRLPAITKRQVSIAQVKFNPYALSLTIDGLSLKEPNGDVFASFDEFYANFQPWASLFKRSWVFAEISLKTPVAQIIYQPDGNFNFANLLDNHPAPRPTNAAPTVLPSLVIYDLNITNGNVTFSDLKRATPFHTEFSPISVNLTNLSTIRDRNSPYSFLARTGAGETFGWSGSVTINPLSSSGTFRIGGLKLPNYATYAHDYARFEVAKGSLDVAADYHYDSSTNALDLIVSNAVVYLSNLELKSPDTHETVLAITNLSVTGAQANVAQRTARIGLVKSDGGAILVRQNHDGTINLLSLIDLPSKSASETKKTATADSAPFKANIDEIMFTNYTIQAEDKKPAKPASFTVDQLAFDLKGVSNQTNAPVTALLSLRFQNTGLIQVNGTTTLMPPSADLQLGLTNVDLRSIQPYVSEQIKLVINNGAVNLNGRARYAEPNSPLITFTGDVSVNKFATADDVLFKDFAKWDALDIAGIHFQMQPDKLAIDEIKFTGLNTSLIIGPDHRANLQTILRNQIAAKTNQVAASTGTTAAAATSNAESVSASNAKKNFDISLGTLAFENASIHFSDQSIEPHCVFDVQEFGGTIKGLSSQPNLTAVVDLHGKVDARSPFAVTGKIQPLGGDLYADISVSFTNTELTAFTPYTEKFAGRPLQKGKLSFSVHYLIDKKALKSENGFYIDQLSLGGKNNSPDATKLPVKLAIALLKDRHGRIQLDVPVTGRLDDPKFKIGPIIWHVVMNLITKAATSPFSLLGSMFGGGNELSFVNFQPGLATIPDAETNKLATLNKALYERPELTMEINGSVDPAQDRAPLAQLKLDQQLESLWIKEQTDAGKPPAALDDVHLDPADHDRLLKLDYENIFGKYDTNNVSTNQAPAPVAQPIAAAFPTPAAPRFKTRIYEHGATALMFRPAKVASPAAQPAPAIAASEKTTTPAEPAAAPNELADMQARLLQKTEVTEDDYRALMNHRAATVQSYLLRDGKIAPDRLFITAPKPMSANSVGQDRVNLTLD
jgi:hypothetical protein